MQHVRLASLERRRTGMTSTTKKAKVSENVGPFLFSPYFTHSTHSQDEPPVVFADLLARLPPELLQAIVEASSDQLKTYTQLLSLSHAIRTRFRGTPRAMSFDREPCYWCRIPTVDALAALVGPCKNLTKLTFPQDLYGCGCSEAARAGWVRETFGGHHHLTTLIFPYSTSFAPEVIEQILSHLPGLAELHLNGVVIITRLLAALARSCPHLQVLRIEGGWLGKPDFSVLAPLAGSLQQLIVRIDEDEADLFQSDVSVPDPAFLPTLTALQRLDVCNLCFPPAAIVPLASQLTHFELLGDMAVPQLPIPWLCRLERLVLLCPNVDSASVLRVLEANRATLCRASLDVTAMAAAELAAITDSLAAMPLLIRLKLHSYSHEKQVGLLPLIPPAGLLSRLERFTMRRGTTVTVTESHHVRIVSSRLRRFDLQATIDPQCTFRLSLDCPALEDLMLPKEVTIRQLGVIRCPRLRRIMGLPDNFHGFQRPMPDLTFVDCSKAHPAWAAHLLVESPRLQFLDVRELPPPDLLAQACATSLTVLFLSPTYWPANPFIIQLPGQLEKFSLHGPDGCFPLTTRCMQDLHVEGAGLRYFRIVGEDGVRLLRLNCPALEFLALDARCVHLELAEGTEPLELQVQAGPTPDLETLFTQRGARLRRVSMHLCHAWLTRKVTSALCGLPRLSSLSLEFITVPARLKLACPQLRVFELSGREKWADRTLELTCPLLERVKVPESRGPLLKFAVRAPNLVMPAVTKKKKA
ncbi:hypothetical protein PAPYR_9038 [Paratrimastix pyriformis]|uniref:F-box domain-containing protein n=1 Tax=Paratrimastix pyriformis TaxID=342808 RepID=A0ABQ8U9B8_9EUKA|nr:hypothetical protein PAPYR_9038 [Paratrimastix pyriformis]